MSLSSLLCRQEGVIYISHPLKETLILGNQENREVPLNLHVEGRWYSGNLHTHSNVFSQPAQIISPHPHTQVTDPTRCSLKTTGIYSVFSETFKTSWF